MAYDELVLRNQKKLETLREVNRNKERAKQLLAQYKMAPVVSQTPNLKKNLLDILPPHLVPQNVGNINQVAWPFYQNFNFDMGTAPTINKDTRMTNTFQVTQEAAFLFMAISRYCSVYDGAGSLAPLQVELRDNQSARMFNSSPIPIQQIGKQGLPTILPTPMLLMPNAQFEMTLSSWLTGDDEVVGEDLQYKHQFTLFGYKMRIPDAENVLGTIFG